MLGKEVIHVTVGQGSEAPDFCSGQKDKVWEKNLSAWLSTLPTLYGSHPSLELLVKNCLPLFGPWGLK